LVKPNKKPNWLPGYQGPEATKTGVVVINQYKNPKTNADTTIVTANIAR
jgi:hypothetical protein